jgi:hypothetical protein
MIEHVNKAQAGAAIMADNLEQLLVEIFAFKETQAFDDLSPKGKRAVNDFWRRASKLQHEVKVGTAEVSRMTNRFIANT